MDALEKVTFELLTGVRGSIAISGASVFENVPEDTLPPVVIIGDMEAVPLGEKGDPDRKIALTILVVTDGEERKPVLGFLQQIESILSDVSEALAPWTLTFTFATSTATLTPEGDGYVGTSIFDIFALKD
ncbi:hypothetical protein KFK14_17665 [Sphingobium phenoxybenzoativorans]|uniref:DUF3168 domain-containing protein n=1 Tax=Sphingobium phenoxybenzoativorans TaxID=1592790 RepID=A0A975Q0Q0_9SPHN|nr:DUF3168 domain-containing protein [Sphingobium phenoxybenzoativorans]QUT04841.1 hypothetical protein KFK14_17665 [Sphingobium phenoxybenzoativorans]